MLTWYFSSWKVYLFINSYIKKKLFNWGVILYKPMHKCLSIAQWLWCMLSHVRLFVTPWTVAHQAPLSLGFSRQEHWRGLLFPPPGALPNSRIEPASPAFPALQADALPLSHQRFTYVHTHMIPTQIKIFLENKFIPKPNIFLTSGTVDCFFLFLNWHKWS